MLVQPESHHHQSSSPGSTSVAAQTLSAKGPRQGWALHTRAAEAVPLDPWYPVPSAMALRFAHGRGALWVFPEDQHGGSYKDCFRGC